MGADLVSRSPGSCGYDEQVANAYREKDPYSHSFATARVCMSTSTPLTPHLREPVYASASFHNTLPRSAQRSLVYVLACGGRETLPNLCETLSIDRTARHRARTLSH